MIFWQKKVKKKFFPKYYTKKFVDISILTNFAPSNFKGKIQ